jgi:hypothetical protein
MIPFALASKLPLVWKYRKWIGYGLVICSVLALFFAYRHALIKKGREEGRAEVLAKWDEAISVSNREIAKKDTAYAALQGERDKASAEVQALLNRPPPDPRTLIVRIPTDAPVTSCPDRSPEWVRAYNALAAAADSGAPTP